VRVNLVLVGDPRRQMTHHRLGIGDADVVAFDRADERFSYSVALRIFDGRRSVVRLPPDTSRNPHTGVFLGKNPVGGEQHVMRLRRRPLHSVTMARVARPEGRGIKKSWNDRPNVSTGRSIILGTAASFELRARTRGPGRLWRA
jgi:hypothetical protein